jgi:hypothetical protein
LGFFPSCKFVTQGLSRALGIEYHLHCAWCPQSSGKVEKTNELLKRHLANLAQETHSPWTKLLPIALIRLRNTPSKQGLTAFESLYGSPFLTNDLLLDQETAQLISHVTQLAKFQLALSEIKQATPREDIKGPPLFCLGDLVLIKSPKPIRDLNTLLWEGPYPVILSTLTAVRVTGLDPWIHHLSVKGWNSSVNVIFPPPDPELEPASFSCELLDGLKLLFKKKMPTNTAKSPP